MGTWTPASIAAMLTALAGALTAAGALYHSIQTRSAQAQHEQDHPPASH